MWSAYIYILYCICIVLTAPHSTSSDPTSPLRCLPHLCRSFEATLMYVPGPSDPVRVGEAKGPPSSPLPCSSLCELCAQCEEDGEADRAPVSTPAPLATASATFGEVDSESANDWKCVSLSTNLYMHRDWRLVSCWLKWLPTYTNLNYAVRLLVVHACMCEYIPPATRSSAGADSHEWRTLMGKFHSITVVPHLCASSRHPLGVSPDCHFGDGCMDIIAKRSASARLTHVLTGHVSPPCLSACNELGCVLVFVVELTSQVVITLHCSDYNV